MISTLRIFAGSIVACLALVSSPDARNAYPSIIEATLACDTEAVQQILVNGGDPDIFDNARNTALIYAARDGKRRIVDVLMTHGASVNWIDGEGVTALILAAHKGHVDIASLLLENGADRSIRDQWNRTALDYALRRGENDAIALRLQKGP